MEKQVPVFQRDEAAEVCSSLSVSALSRASARLGPPVLPQQLASHFPSLPFAPAGEVGFEPCYAEVLRVVQGKLHQPDEVQRGTFYAFSYYYDRAVDTDMIGKFTPGVSVGRAGQACGGEGRGQRSICGALLSCSPCFAPKLLKWESLV